MSNIAKWSDQEKLALFVSIIKASGPKINWANVALPVGRSKMACTHIYMAAMKESSSIPMASLAENQAGIKKRGPKKGIAAPKKAAAAAGEGGKRKRGRSAAQAAGDEMDSGDDAVAAAKKAKIEEEEGGDGDGEEEEDEEKGAVEFKEESM